MSKSEKKYEDLEALAEVAAAEPADDVVVESEPVVHRKLSRRCVMMTKKAVASR